MKTIAIASALALVLALGVSAQAEIITTVTPLGVPTKTGAFPDSLPGNTAFKLTFATDNGEVIAAYDFGTWETARNPAFGFFGPVVQRWPYADEWVPTVQATQLNYTESTLSLDSHFLPPWYVPAIPHYEKNDLAGVGSHVTTLKDIYGDGSVIMGVGWGFGELRGEGSVTLPFPQSLDVAYIIVPDGQTVTYVGELATFDGASMTTHRVSGLIFNPEPSALGVLAIGGAVALLRRKAKA